MAGALQRLSLLCQGCGGATEMAKLLRDFICCNKSQHHTCSHKYVFLGLKALSQMT